MVQEPGCLRRVLRVSSSKRTAEHGSTFIRKIKARIEQQDFSGKTSLNSSNGFRVRFGGSLGGVEQRQNGDGRGSSPSS